MSMGALVAKLAAVSAVMLASHHHAPGLAGRHGGPCGRPVEHDQRLEFVPLHRTIS